MGKVQNGVVHEGVVQEVVVQEKVVHEGVVQKGVIYAKVVLEEVVQETASSIDHSTSEIGEMKIINQLSSPYSDKVDLPSLTLDKSVHNLV